MDAFTSLEHRALGAGAQASGQASQDVAASRVASVQHLLAQAGFDPGTRAGQLDPRTRESLGAFQAACGLPVTKTIDSETHAALQSATPSQAGPAPRALPFDASPNGRLPLTRGLNMGKMWKGTPKRVPVIFAQSALAAATTNTLAITPSWPFRGENLVIDPTTGALCTVQIPSVGPNPQVAGGTPSTNIPGTAFPPTQTAAVALGMDISEQGNQLSLTFTNSQTSLTLNFVALVMGAVVEEMTQQEQAAHVAACLRTGIAPAGNFVPHTAIAPAGSYVR